MRKWIWIAFTALGACLPLGHPGIPDKAEVPTTGQPEASATPEKSACELHVEQLQDEIDNLREMLRDVAPGDGCYCGDEE